MDRCIAGFSQPTAQDSAFSAAAAGVEWPPIYEPYTSAHHNDVRSAGYRVRKNLGVVRGIIVRSRSVIGNIGASLQTIIGGNITVYTSLCERTRSDAFQLMLTHAGELGANAVIGVRYDATEIGPGITEVLCYGTAVFVEPTSEGVGER